MTAIRHGNLYILNGSATASGDFSGASNLFGELSGAQVNLASTNDIRIWHQRLGHLNFESLIRMAKGKAVIGLPDTLATDQHFCEDCTANKLTQQPFQE